MNDLAFFYGIQKAAGAYDFPMDPHRTKKLVAAGVGGGALLGAGGALLAVKARSTRKKKRKTAA